MKPPRWRRRALALVILLALLVAALGGNTLRNKQGYVLRRDTPAERLAMLAPFWRVWPAEAPVAAAGAILLPGCDGVHDNMDYWAAALATRGRPALILDSHTPRGIQGMELWRLTCAGQILTGAERAGDVAVALTASRPDRVALLGASHGGWTVLELLGQVASGQLPPGLSAWPDRPEALRRRIDRVVLLYPYCGALNGAARGDWAGMPPIVLIAAGRDRIVSTPDCLALADDLRGRGADIRVTVLPDVDHAFDQAERSVLSPLELVPEARDAARRLVEAFLG